MQPEKKKTKTEAILKTKKEFNTHKKKKRVTGQKTQTGVLACPFLAV